MMFGHQIRGMIAISIILAFIPLTIFFIPFFFKPDIPILSTSGSNCKSLVVEIVQENGESGIFFVNPGTTTRELLLHAGIKCKIQRVLKLQSGTAIHLNETAVGQEITVRTMAAEKRLALGLPLDINLVSLEDLTLVPGIGEGLALRILAWRTENVRFEKIEQLMDVNGIKEKKLVKLKRYLYIDKTVDRNL